MTKKEIKEFFGHSFPQMAKNPRIINITEELIVFVDRSGQVTNIKCTADLTNKIVRKGFDEFTGEEWIQRMNWNYKGQPLSLCAESVKADYAAII